jgi:DNA polymerase-3 subunit gamma/tau
VSGQRATVAVLHRMAQRRNLPTAMLFSGMFGSGKTTSARILASALNCAEPPGPAAVWPCGSCPSCKAVTDGTSLDVIEVDAASNGTVERIGEICDLVQYGTAGEWRVVILDEAHSMSRDAGNRLLKTMEEPPPGTLFILCTTDPGKLPRTIVSRCVPFAFARLDAAVIAARLAWICEAEGVRADGDLLLHLAARADGAMRDAIMLLDQAVSVGIRSLAAWQQLTLEEDFAPALLAAAAAGRHAELYAELDKALLTCSDYSALTRELVFCLRDVLRLADGGTVTAQGAALESRRALAHSLPKRRVVEAMRVLWDLQVRTRVEDRRAGLELAAAMLAERLCPPAQDKPAVNGHAATAPVTAEYMANLEGFRR